MKTFDQAMREICASMSRGAPTAALGLPPPGSPRPFSLTVGTPESEESGVVAVRNGHVICLGLTREQVEVLKSQCEEALALS